MKHTITETLFIHAYKTYAPEGYKLSLKICDMSEYGYICLGKTEVSVDYELPDGFNFTQCEIDLLRKEQKRIQADAQMKLTKLEEQIQKLLCLEHKQ